MVNTEDFDDLIFSYSNHVVFTLFDTKIGSILWGSHRQMLYQPDMEVYLLLKIHHISLLMLVLLHTIYTSQLIFP